VFSNKGAKKNIGKFYILDFTFNLKNTPKVPSRGQLLANLMLF
jgi:hypothetical protein